MYVQWYWAPEIGQMLAISATLAAQASVPEITNKNP